MTVVVLLVGLLLHAQAYAVTLSVVDPGGNGVAGYRWLIEEDNTYHVQPGVPDPNTLSVRFHASYMPVVAKGDAATPLPALDATKHYYLSVLPDAGYTIGGAAIAPGQQSVRVVVNPLPLPTAQITIFVFQDNEPINNAPDLPAEAGLAGFKILLEDAGGRYGISAGQKMMDAFGNPLGTTYNPDGSVAAMGNGVILTDANGEAVIKNLAPGKYGVQAVPPAGQGWVQTATIEGTRVIDAWVKANEPPYFQEFGPPGYHVFIGFIKPTNDTTVLTGGSTITGQVVNLHLSRPPDFAFYNGAPLEHTTAWVGLNVAGGVGRGVYAQRCNGDGTFSIPNVPPGDYQLVVWDSALDIIFAFHQVTVPPAGGPVALGDVPVFQWFSRLENHVFYDEDGDGFMDPGEMGIPGQNVNLRWRDGTIYQAAPTDGEGFVPFDEVFPFFAWLVAEVDFARFKATGVTVVVDDGGAINPADPWTFGGQLNPQIQPDGLPYRTETGPVLLEAFQNFLGQTSVMMWGKQAYGPGENGGISGIVFYSTTRAENNPEQAFAEVWEPGIPRVTVELYDATGTVLLNRVTTDSWDDNQPSGCPGEPFVFMGQPKDCYDGLRCFNQVRPGVFDGGYAFTTVWLPTLNDPAAVEGTLPAGEYVVKVIPPPGYQIVRSQDKNVDFGDEYEPSLLALPPPCVGPEYTVPDELSLYPGVPAPLAGQTLNDCDCKKVRLSNGQNAAADFHLFTEVPIAGHIYGFILDDTSNEFDPAAPTFGEKFAPPWLPVSIRDWTGQEIGRTYSDQYGVYNALVPSTYTANQPQPSGMSPNMITVCLNSPVMPDPNNPGQLIPDPFFNRQYSQFCYTFQYMPGTTTYLDTPVIPVAAFAGLDQFPLDCEFPGGTPVIHSVSRTDGSGPYVSATGQQIAIVSAGANVAVPNPLYDGPGGTQPKTITRDYGFGSTQGTVTIGGRPLTVAANGWSPDVIVATVPSGTTTGQLEVVRGDNQVASIVGVTVTVGNQNGTFNVLSVPQGGPIQPVIDAAGPGDLILVPPGNYEEMVVMWKPVRLQGWGAASTVINAVKAPAEKLLFWRQKIESVITSGLVDLLPGQEIGFGGIEPVTLFNEEGPGIIVLARDTTPGRGGFGLRRSVPNARIDGLTITGADHGGGIIVNGYAHYLQIGNNRIINNSGVFGGGIRVGHPTLIAETPQGLQYQSGFNDHIRIHHNHITQNGGLGGAGGGVSLCHGSDYYEVSENFICGNFTLGDGGGIGHFGLSESAGGWGLIANNSIIFNESFNQGQTVHGGGIFIGGAQALTGPLSPGSGPVKVISNLIQGNAAGAGDGGGIRTERVNGQDVAQFRNSLDRWYSVDVLNNMIVNNVAALAGGGISLQDTARSNVLCNTITHNDSVATAGNAFSPGSPNQSNPQPGAGIVSHAHTPELAAAFGPSPQVNLYRLFARPRLTDNIIWRNRSFYFSGDPNADPPVYGLLPDPNTPVYSDLAVVGTATPQQLGPTYCILTNPAGYAGTNRAADPRFMAEYYNGDRGLSVTIPEVTTAIQAPPAFDEGGNFIRVRFGPLTLTRPDTGLPFGNYHIRTVSGARDTGTNAVLALFPELRLDFDGQIRPNPNTNRTDIGADERYSDTP